jgi:hypothetical protein
LNGRDDIDLSQLPMLINLKMLSESSLHPQWHNVHHLSLCGEVRLGSQFAKFSEKINKVVKKKATQKRVGINLVQVHSHRQECLADRSIVFLR